MTNTFLLIVLGLTFVVGLLFCLRGYKSLRFFIAIYAFWLGFSGIWQVLTSYAPVLGSTWTWIVALLAGLVFAILAFVFIKLACFLAGGLLGIALFRLIGALNPVFMGSLSPLVSFLIGLIFFLVLGFVAVAAKRFLIVLATSVWGAYTAVASAGILLGLLVHPVQLPVGLSLNAYSAYSIFAAAPTAVPIVIMTVLAIFGIIVQNRRAGRAPARRSRR